MSLIDFIDDDENRSVKVSNTNGIRHGTFEIHGVKGYFPLVAITSTNLNHVKYAGIPILILILILLKSLSSI